MGARIIKKEGNRITVELTVELKNDMLFNEESILRSINEASMVIKKYDVSRFDTDGAQSKVKDKK